MRVEIKADYIDGGRFLVRAWDKDPGEWTEKALLATETATLGSVVKTRNKMLTEWSNRAEVSEITAKAIPWPAEYYHFQPL